MDTPTPILGLRRFTSGDDLDFADINFNSNMTDLIPTTVCTSTTRPTTNLFNGRMIWETDTDTLQVYNLALPGWEPVYSRRMPRGKATQTGTGQALTTATYTGVLFNSEDYDTTGVSHSIVTNTERIVITTPGLYTVAASVTFASNATGIRKASITLNAGTTVVNDSRGAIAGSTTTCNMSADISLAANDYLWVQAYQNSGGNLSLDTSVGSTWLSVRWVSEAP